jgi:hypothetical protein
MSSTVYRHVLLMAAVVIVEVIQVWVMSISCCIVCTAGAFFPWCALEDDEMCCSWKHDKFYYKWNETKLHWSFYWPISDENIYSSFHVTENTNELLRSKKKWHSTDTILKLLRLPSPLICVKMQQLLVIFIYFLGLTTLWIAKIT